MVCWWVGVLGGGGCVWVGGGWGVLCFFVWGADLGFVGGGGVGVRLWALRGGGFWDIRGWGFIFGRSGLGVLVRPFWVRMLGVSFFVFGCVRLLACDVGVVVVPHVISDFGDCEV